MPAREVAARYRLATDPEWQSRWGWPDVQGYTVEKGGGIGQAIYRHTSGDFSVTFDIGGSSFKSDLSVRKNRGRYRTKAEIPVILEQLAEAWAAKKGPKKPKDPVETVSVTGDEATAFRFIVHEGDRDGNLFTRATTLEVAEGVGWDTAKAYRVLNNLSRKGVVVKGGRVPVKRDGPGGYQGPDVTNVIGWQYWHVELPENHDGEPVPLKALEQVGFKPW